MTNARAASSASPAAAPRLDELRAAIDRLDDQLLALVEERLAMTKAVAEYKRSTEQSTLLLRPDRERQLLERLTRASSLPGAIVEAIWREIMACSLQLQQVTELAIHAARRPILVTDLARLRFGCAAPLRIAASPAEALERARSQPAIGVIELDPASDWWTALLQQDSVAIFDWLVDGEDQAVALLVGRCDPSCRVPGLSFPILSAAELQQRLTAGEPLRPLAATGDLRLCLSRS